LFHHRQTWGQFTGRNELYNFSTIQSCLVFLFGNSVRKSTEAVEEIQKEIKSIIIEEQNKFGDIVIVEMVTVLFIKLSIFIQILNHNLLHL
jgi:hypothetical protein